MIAENQAPFRSCYRSRQRSWYHLSYLRLAKVRFVERLVAEGFLTLEGANVLDFSCGAGTFLRNCPPSARLHGTEIDHVNVDDVSNALISRGVTADLRVCESSADLPNIWPNKTFDVILLSHVLEHVDGPTAMLADLSAMLSPSGKIICLVPINERNQDPKHITAFDRASLTATASAAGLKSIALTEDDPWLYWIIGHFYGESRLRRFFVQLTTLTFGTLTCVPGWKFWSRAGKVWAFLTASKPTQLAAVLVEAAPSHNS